MNYFEHHIGDYAEATAHLSFAEDAAYSRCIRKYYAKEKPLPADVKAVQRLIGARTEEEKDAVETILNEFFVLAEDGWRNERCDADIASYQAGEPEREAKKANEETRLRRHRDERAALFQQLTAAGLHAAWNTTIRDLRKMVKDLPATPTATAPATETAPAATPPVTATPATPATAPATPATATQTPLPNTHIPIYVNTLSEKIPDEQTQGKGEEAPSTKPELGKATPEDEACAKWLYERILKNNRSHKPPRFAVWANDVRLLRERDGQTHREICEMFDWAQDDSFWRANILSPAKLREKWDQLKIKRGKSPTKGQKHGNFATQDYRAGVRSDGSF